MERPATFAIHCNYLKRSPQPGRMDQYVALCLHPVREGKACVGPFLEDLTTDCGLWEPNPHSQLIPLPQPERWQRRRRREGFDYTRAYRDERR
jgi:hypothetical protein